VNAIQFSPNDSNVLASAGSDGKALLWDTSEMLPEIKSPIKEYSGNSSNEGPMENLIWSPHETNWVAACKGREVYALKVDPSKKA
jgi:WD40 repeat protein